MFGSNKFYVRPVEEMSGFISKLKNKVSYKINQVVDDPAANEYAKKDKEEGDKNAVAPSPKSLEELRADKMNELRKDESFSKGLDGKIQELITVLQKKYKGEGKSEKDSQELSAKYFMEKVIPSLNELIDGKANGGQILDLIVDEIDILSDTEDPNSISPTRILKKTWRYIKIIASYLLIPILAIIVSMYVANEMIVHPAPIRAGFFILTMIMSIAFQPVLIGMCLYYLAKSGYSYYVNEMTAREKQRIMPTIFSILPLTTYQPEGLLESFFYYPFTYPKSKKDSEELPKIMEEYQAKLDDSFKYLQKIKSLSFVTQGLELIKDNMEKMHKPPENLIGEKKENTLPPVLKLTNKEREEFSKIGRNSKSNSAVPAETATPSAPPVNANQNKGQQVPPPVNANQNKGQQVPPPVVIPPPAFNNTTTNQKTEPNKPLPPVIEPVPAANVNTTATTATVATAVPTNTTSTTELPPTIPIEEKKEEKEEEEKTEEKTEEKEEKEEKEEEKTEEKEGKEEKTEDRSPRPDTIQST